MFLTKNLVKELLYSKVRTLPATGLYPDLKPIMCECGCEQIIFRTDSREFLIYTKGLNIQWPEKVP